MYEVNHFTVSKELKLHNLLILLKNIVIECILENTREFSLFRIQDKNI